MAAITVYYEGPIVTREEAQVAGLSRYFTGEPCVHGHVIQRYAVNQRCRACMPNAAVGSVIRIYHTDDPPASSVTVFYTGPIILRKEAKALSLKRYFTGKACPYGHVAQRIVSSYGCARCGLAHNGKASSRATRNRWKRTEKGKAAERRSRERNKEKWRPWYVAYRATPKGKMLARANKAARRAREYAARGVFTAEDERKLRERQKQCHICGKRFTKADSIHLDHVIALADGGTHDASNIALAHEFCNRSKSARRTHLI